jgi:N-acetylglucosamine kinase-like BadF-type ATPase
MSSPVYVGIDGGATRSRAVVLGSDGRELGRAGGPACLVSARTPAAAADTVARVVREAAAAAGAGLPVTRLVAGLAGAGRPEAREAVQRALARAGVARVVEVRTDGAIALDDAFGEGAGILLVAGTGSLALGRAEDRREARAGGWGAVLGDEGSGSWMGLQALRALVRAADGRGPGTLLQDVVLSHLGLRSPEELVRWAEGASKRTLAALAPVVLDAADQGDAVARRLAGRAARELAGAAAAVRDALEPWSAPPVVAGVGGLIGPGGGLQDRLAAALAARSLHFDPRQVDAARGAARRAWREGGSGVPSGS